MGKIEVKVDARGRLTLPEKVKKHLRIDVDDDAWFEILPDGNVVVGRIEVNKKIID